MNHAQRPNGCLELGQQSDLIMLPDISVSPVEQILAGMQLVFEQRAPLFLLHQAFALSRRLPVGNHLGSYSRRFMA